MTDKLILDLAELDAADLTVDDMGVVVDVSDTSMDASGTTKKLGLTAAFGGTFVLHTWNWDDALDTLIPEVHSVFELTTDPAPSGNTTLSVVGGSEFSVASNINAADLLTAFQANDNPDHPVVSVTGGPFGTAPFVVEVTGNFNGGGDISDTGAGDFLVAVNHTQDGTDEVLGFYLDLGQLPEGALVTALYPAITEDFAFDGGSSTILAKLYADIDGLSVGSEIVLYASYGVGLLGDLLDNLNIRGASRRLVATAGREYPAAVLLNGGTLTAGAVDWIATYIIPPNPVTLELPSSDFWND